MGMATAKPIVSIRRNAVSFAFARPTSPTLPAGHYWVTKVYICRAILVVLSAACALCAFVSAPVALMTAAQCAATVCREEQRDCAPAGGSRRRATPR